MKKINPNQLIIQISKSLRYLVLVLLALLSSKIVWWTINPLGYTQIENPALKSEKSQDFAQAIINRAAFGIYVEEHAATPTINVKVIGVYAAGPSNSVAFLQVDEKHIIASIGDSVLEGKIKTILPTGIVITTNNQDIIVNIGGSNAMSNTPNNTSSAQANTQQPAVSPYNSAAVRSNANHEQISDVQPPANLTDRTPADKDNTDNTSTTNINSNSNNSDDSVMSKRQKMIQQFQQQNSNTQN